MGNTCTSAGTIEAIEQALATFLATACGCAVINERQPGPRPAVPFVSFINVAAQDTDYPYHDFDGDMNETISDATYFTCQITAHGNGAMGRLKRFERLLRAVNRWSDLFKLIGLGGCDSVQNTSTLDPTGASIIEQASVNFHYYAVLSETVPADWFNQAPFKISTGSQFPGAIDANRIDWIVTAGTVNDGHGHPQQLGTDDPNWVPGDTSQIWAIGHAGGGPAVAHCPIKLSSKHVEYVSVFTLPYPADVPAGSVRLYLCQSSDGTPAETDILLSFLAMTATPTASPYYNMGPYMAYPSTPGTGEHDINSVRIEAEISPGGGSDGFTLYFSPPLTGVRFLDKTFSGATP
jgi:hypothetical protein